MNFKHKLQERIKAILVELDVNVDAIELTHPHVTSQGDYTTNVAMIAAKQAGENPRELADEIRIKMQDSGFTDEIEKIEVAGPGFINFYLSEEYFITRLKELVTEGDVTEQSGSFKGRKVMVEFTDPNPFKEFHIGHLYSNTVGESISRLIESQGAEVKRANYQGDVGLHVAKAIWGMKAKLKTENMKLSDIEQRTVEERAKWLGEAYAFGASAYGDPRSKEEIIEINKQVYMVVPNHSEGSYPEISLLYHKGRHWSLEYFASMYARLGTNFDYYYFESKVGLSGLALVKEYLDKGIFTKSEGAVVFKGEEHGLHTRVFINSLGLPTYEAKELGLAMTKYKEYPFDLSLSITGNEINEYFKVLLRVLSLISPEIAEKTKHISHGMVRLPEGKMSSRTGNVITGEWLLDEAVRRLSEVYPEMNEATVERVAVGAIKWALLRVGIGKDISFNIDESISFEGDSGPYIQYTYARARSVLGKVERDPCKADASQNDVISVNEVRPESLSGEEVSLLKLLVQFDEVVREAAVKFAPHVITNYLFDLAQAFNLFYQKQRILQAEGEHRVLRLALTEATGKVLKQGLHLLGIQAPEKM